MSSPRPAPLFDELESRLAGAMLADRHRLLRQLRSIRQGGSVGGDRLARWVHQLEISESIRGKRDERRPRAEFDESLPVCRGGTRSPRRSGDHQVVIVCGETGSGKSTQLPKICLELGRGIDGMIGHTQPRRIAARSRRRADRRGTRLAAGPRRWASRSASPTRPSPQTYIKLMTDGILLAETQGDPLPRPVRHDHPRRGPRAVAEHRLPDRLPEAAAAQAAAT